MPFSPQRFGSVRYSATHTSLALLLHGAPNEIVSLGATVWPGDGGGDVGVVGIECVIGKDGRARLRVWIEEGEEGEPVVAWACRSRIEGEEEESEDWGK